MANTNFIDLENLNYCGQEAQEIFSKDIYSLDLNGYGITLMDNVKGKMKIYTGEVGSVWQEYTCPFTPDGDVALNEGYIEPVTIKVNMENCYDAFWNTYLVEQTRINLDGGIPQTFFDWFFNNKLRAEMSKEYQEIFWKGDISGSTLPDYLQVTDGVETIITAETGATSVSGDSFTIDNIVAQVEGVIEAGLETMAEENISGDDFKLFMNKHDVRLLKIALGKDCSCNLSTSIFRNYALEGDRVYVMGFEVIPTEMDKNFILFGPAKNLILGYDTFDSHLEYRILDMKESTGDNMFRVIAISNIAVGVVFPELFSYMDARS